MDKISSNSIASLVPNTNVRHKNNPGRVGTLTGNKRERGTRIYYQVKYSDGTNDYIFENELESDELEDFAAPGLKVIPAEVPVEEVDDEPEPEIELESEPKEVVAKKPSGNQGELLLGGGPKGRFDGESPNVVKDGEDLDIPPYLRKRNRRR